jgi:hypothetical protein
MTGLDAVRTAPAGALAMGAMGSGDPRAAAERIVAENTGRFGTLDEAGIARDVAVLARGDEAFANAVLSEMKGLLGRSFLGGDDFAQVMKAMPGAILAAQDEALRAQGLTPEQRALILDLTQLTLDVGGIVDPTGALDGANAVISVARGDFLGAGISLVAMVPYVGDLAKAGKLGKAAELVARLAAEAATSPQLAKMVRPGLEALSRAVDALPSGVAGDLRAALDSALARTDLSRMDWPVTRPTGEVGGMPTGTRSTALPNAEAGFKEGIRLENEAADALANRGFKVHQLADGELSPAEMRMRGLTPGKNPDFLIEGKVYDAYSPEGGLSAVYSGIKDKVASGQSTNIVLNLGRTSASRAEIENYLRQNPVANVEEVLIIGRDGSVGRLRL